MTKQQKIQEEYLLIIENNLDRFKCIKDFIDENGWFTGVLAKVSMSLLDTSGHEVRPKSLDGIENNNGWNSIEEDIFPEDTDTVLWLNNENYEMEKACLMTVDFNYKEYTHWHALPPKAPIY